MNKHHVRHPETEELLLYIDGELPWTPRAAVRRHLEGCWKCRTELEQLGSAVSEFMRYKSRLDAAIGPLSRHTSAELSLKMEQLDRELAVPGLWQRVHAWLGPSSLFGARRLAFGILALAGTALAVMLVERFAPLVWHGQPPPLVSKPAPSKPVSPPAPPLPLVAPRLPKIQAAAPSPLPEPEAAVPRANPEVAAWVKLHELGADLGEPVDVVAAERGSATVICRQIGAEREAEIRSALSNVPGVTVRADQAPAAERRSRAVLSPGSAAIPLEQSLIAALGGRGAFDRLANEILEADDGLMARAHAIRGLEQRFPADRVAALSISDRASLDRIAADHRRAARDAGHTIQALLAPVLKALGATTTPDAAASNLFAAASRMDRVVNVIFGGSPTSLTSQDLAAELATAQVQLARAVEAMQ